MAEVNSLYIHIPFCEHIGSYCDFTKIIKNDNLCFIYGLDIIKSLVLLNKEGKKFKTIYIGGGTPSCLDLFVLEDVLIAAKNLLDIDYEFTIELNVESVNLKIAKLLKKHNINRISVGIQTFNDEILDKFNRKHTGNDAIEAVKLLKRFFDNISVDLIYAVPFSSMAILENDIKIIKELNINHVSTYSLQINKGTLIYNQGYKEISQDETRSQMDFIHNELIKQGFEHYEVSNFGKKGYFSNHNLTYWKNEEYEALGAGASGYLNNIRFTYTKNILEYLKTHRKEEEIVTQEDKFEYQVMLGLRTSLGVNLNDIKDEFGIDFLQKYEDKLEYLFKNKLIFVENNTLKCSYEGLFILDAIILKIF